MSRGAAWWWFVPPPHILRVRHCRALTTRDGAREHSPSTATSRTMAATTFPTIEPYSAPRRRPHLPRRPAFCARRGALHARPAGPRSLINLRTRSPIHLKTRAVGRGMQFHREAGPPRQQTSSTDTSGLAWPGCTQPTLITHAVAVADHDGGRILPCYVDTVPAWSGDTAHCNHA